MFGGKVEKRIARLRLFASWKRDEQVSILVPIAAHVVCVESIVCVQLSLRDDDSMRVERISFIIMSQRTWIQQQMDHRVLIAEEGHLPVAEGKCALEKGDAPSTASDHPVRRAQAPALLSNQQVNA